MLLQVLTSYLSEGDALKHQAHCAIQAPNREQLALLYSPAREALIRLEASPPPTDLHDNLQIEVILPGQMLEDIKVHGQIVLHRETGSVLEWSDRVVGGFGSKGNKPGQFVSPGGVGVDGEGNVLVADSSNHRVQVMGIDGTHLRTIGGYGRDAGQLSIMIPCGRGVAVDAQGNLLVAAPTLIITGCR